MAAFVFTRALGSVAQLASLPAANDAIVWVLVNGLALEDDAILREYETLDQLLANNPEASFSGYVRIEHTASISITVDHTFQRVDVDDGVDPDWSPTSVETIGAIVACYDPDTTGGTD